MSRRRTCLLMLGLLTAAPLAQALSPARPPQVPEQVSNVAWAGDMARFASADQANPPPRGGIEFIGSSSIRFWESLATDFPGQPVFNRGFGGSEVRDSTWYACRSCAGCATASAGRSAWPASRARAPKPRWSSGNAATCRGRIPLRRNRL